MVIMRSLEYEKMVQKISYKGSIPFDENTKIEIDWYNIINPNRYFIPELVYTEQDYKVMEVIYAMNNKTKI